MNELIKAAPTALHERNLKRIPATRKAYISKSIEDVKPSNLADFMLKNNIPETAYFTNEENYGVSLEWETAAEYWTKVGSLEDAAACQSIVDATRRGDEFRARNNESSPSNA